MAVTPNLNLEKLTGTEKLKVFPGTFNDNMDLIDAAFGSAGAVTDLTSGATWNTTDFTNQSANAVIKTGNVVMLKLYPYINHSTTGASVTIGTLPSSCKPFLNIAHNIIVGSKSVTITIDSTSGNITMYANDNLLNWPMPTLLTFIAKAN